ncbi:unnamed protein product [Mucor hiemalis]
MDSLPTEIQHLLSKHLAACCFLLKDRVKNIHILKEDDANIENVDDDDREISDNNDQAQWLSHVRKPFGRSARFLEYSNQFKNLKKYILVKGQVT